MSSRNWLALVSKEVFMRGMTSAWTLRDKIAYHRIAAKLLLIGVSEQYKKTILTHLALNPIIIFGGKYNAPKPTPPKPSGFNGPGAA